MNCEICSEAVGLLTTYSCNLHCAYCYISHKREREMSLETAQSILEPILSCSGGPVDIIFMGGETLLAEEMIRDLVEWAEGHVWKRRYRFFGSTNGTLLTEELKQWLSRHRNQVTLALSYDGLPSTQRYNRGSDDIDLDFFLHTWPFQRLQMTVNASSVPHMAQGVINLLEKGFRVNLSVAYEKEEWTRSDLVVYGTQLHHLAKYYLAHPAMPKIYQFQHCLPEYAYALNHTVVQDRQCGAGFGFWLFDVDGRRYPCHILSPLTLESEALHQLDILNFETTEDFSDPACKGCPYVSACSTCMGCNFLYRGGINRRDKTHCEVMKLEVASFLWLEAERLRRKNVLTQEDALLIDAIAALHHWQKNQKTKERK